MQEDVSTAGARLEDVSDTRSELVLLVLEQRSLSRYSLDAERLSIGRAQDCDVVLRDPMASRLHAVLHVGPHLVLEDLGSRNGCAVKHQALSANERATVAVGESIQIGRALLVVERAPKRVGATNPPTTNRASFSAAMQQVYALLGKLAPGNLSLLISGETGVGKEVLAAAAHRASGARSNGPYVRINCAALSEALFESELFGHERGSFTGALHRKPGLLEVAHTGTAFLDEIGELPLVSQAKLLRVLEAGEILRVGSVNPQRIDVRFVAATNRDLQVEVEGGRFREDLFFRLAGATLHIPPLRERPGEIVDLAQAFVTTVSAQLDRSAPAISPGAMQRLVSYRWPGNIRELKNVMQLAVLRSEGHQIEVADLPPQVCSPGPRRLSPYPGSGAGDATVAATRSRSDGERERILTALNDCNGNQTRAAEKLGMPRRTLVAKLSVYDLPRPRKL